MSSVKPKGSYFHSKLCQRVTWEVIKVGDAENGRKNYAIKLRWKGTTTLCGKEFDCFRSRIVYIETDNFNSDPSLVIDEHSDIKVAPVGLCFLNSIWYWNR